MGAILGELAGEAGLSGGLTYQTTLVSGASLVFALCLQPIYGALSDKFGRKWLLIWFGAIGAQTNFFGFAGNWPPATLFRRAFFQDGLA